MTIESEIEDEDSQNLLFEIGKSSINFGTQIDLEKKQEIIDLGLNYDNDSAISARLYYNDGDIYTYFNELFSQYIKIDMEDEGKEQFEKIFDDINSKDKVKNSKEAMSIIGNELKSALKEYGEFDREKTTIEIEDAEEKVTKSTVTISEKNINKMLSDICTNLAENDKFIDCFDESLEQELIEFAREIKQGQTNGKGNISISIYTKGLFNSFKGIEGSVYLEDENQTLTMLVIKEDKNIYSYKLSVKTDNIKADVMSGKVMTEKETDKKDEKKGRTTITINVPEEVTLKLKIDYSIEYNKGIDNIDISNSINANDLTQEDTEEIINKLQERPLIKDLIELFNSYNNMNNADENDILLEKEALTTSQNQVKDENYGYSITYSIPKGFNYEKGYSFDYSKYFTLENNNSQIDAKVSLDWITEEEYKNNDINWDYDYYKKETKYYKNTDLGTEKTINVEGKKFKYQILSYESNSEYYNEKYQKAYVWYKLDKDHLFIVELESTNKEITEDTIKGFLTINVTKLK